MDYQKSSNKTWYIIGIIVIAALAFWYFSSRSPLPSATAPTAEQQAQPTSSANTTADITADLNQIPDDTATLNQSENASAAAVQGL